MPSPTPRPRFLPGLALALTLLLPGGCAGQDHEPIVGSCDGCEAIFDGLPDDPPSTARIAPPDEPGTPLRIQGTVFGRDGAPRPGVVVYAWHTDSTGVYPDAPGLAGPAARHGGLRGWAETDARGHYTFETIRPGAYPGRDTPQHVHMMVLEPGCCAYWVEGIHFLDDPLLPDDAVRESDDARGGSALVRPRPAEDGGQVVTRDIRLDRNVPEPPAG